LFPNPKCELDFSNNFELLVAVILSAQCTDKRVNKVTPQLFAKFPTPHDFAVAKQEDVEKMIYSCGFYAQKAKSIISASKDIIQKFDGQVPSTFEQLTSLRGVGRKTANVVLSVAFNQPAIAVDTHVFRVAHRLGLSNANTPLGVEKDLMKLFKPSSWSKIHYQMVLFGRYYCKARGSNEWQKDFLEFEKQQKQKEETCI
jgi:endonuclease-3